MSELWTSIETTVTAIAPTFGGIVVVCGALFTFYRYVIQPTSAAFKKHFDLMDVVAEEFKPNSGSSMKDAIIRIEEKLENVINEQQRHTAKQWAFIANADEPVFETDQQGLCTRVNTMFNNLTERSGEDVLGRGWENIIHQDDKLRVFRDWEDAVTKSKSYEATFRIVGAVTKIVHNVSVIATPFFSTNNTLMGYVGRWKDVEITT